MKCKTIYIVERHHLVEDDMQCIIEAYSNLEDADDACLRHDQTFKDLGLTKFEFIVVPTLLY